MAHDIEDLKRQINIHDLAHRLGLARPDPKGNYRSPHHDDRSPSLQIGGNKYPDGWYDHSAQRGGDCLDLVGYVLGLEFRDAVQWLREQYGIPAPRPERTETRPATLVEHIAAQSLKNVAPAVDYLAGRGILPEVIDRAAKLKAIGFNDWTSPKKPPGSVGYGGPATAFLVRSFNPGQLAAVDLRYHDPALNGSQKTGCQGEKVGYPWTSDLRRLERSETVVIVESPINALSAESAALAGRLSRWAAVASRGLLVESLDVAPYRGKRVLLCFDNDKPDDKGRRPGVEAGWALHARLTAAKIAVHFVDQAEWECNDLNDLLQREGAEVTARALQRLQKWAIPGVVGRVEAGRPRVYLPSADFNVYDHFRVREDFTTRFVVERDKDGNERDVFQDVAGFRIADIARIDIASATATMTGEIDRQPTQLFSVTAQTSFHGSGLIRAVTTYDRLNNVDWWKRIGPIWNPPSLLRLVNIWGRAVTLNQRDAVNFVGLCWKNGKPHVNEGADAYFTDPEKQCPYHNLAFPSGTPNQARQVLRAYASNFSHHAALLLLVWALGAHLKAFLTFWPHMTLEADKGAGKTTLTERLTRTIACTLFSGQSLQTDFRLLTSLSHTSHPVIWEELSARKQEIINRAVSILQEAYKYTTTRRGSELTEFVISAPVLLMGESVEKPAESLLSKVVRVQLRQQGPLMPNDLPAFPVRQWLDFLAGLSREQVATLYGQAVEFCWRQCLADRKDSSARRMVDNYAGLLTAWALLQDFAGLARDEIPLTPALVQEMNEHISQTDAMRQPWVWVVEVILHEIAAGAYPYPYRFDFIDGQDVFYLKCSHMMFHIKTKPGLRPIWDGLTIKSDRVLKKQMEQAGVILSLRAGPVINGKRVDHMVALSMAKLAEYGLHPEEPQKSH